MKLLAFGLLAIFALAGIREFLRSTSQTEKPLPNVDWLGW